MDFDRAFTALIGNEGAYTNDPKDRGNWTSGKIGVGLLKGTKYGISAMTYPTVDIRNLSLDNAKKIYHQEFWLKAHCDELPNAIRFDIFDMAVNSGVLATIKTLQKAIGADPDGIIGSQTKKLLEFYDAERLDKRLSAQRLLYICDIGTFPTFGKGWVRRVANNLLLD
ncbi:MAG: glycosyl hydrolase 108 family protein [Pseudomonadota bacterium]